MPLSACVKFTYYVNQRKNDGVPSEFVTPSAAHVPVIVPNEDEVAQKNIRSLQKLLSHIIVLRIRVRP